MPPSLTLTDARAILGDDVLGPEEIGIALGPSGATAPRIPFTREELSSAARSNEMLVLRTGQVGEGTPLTIMWMVERRSEAFDQKLLRQAGYQLKEEWGIALEPLAAQETCAPGWALVRKQILDNSRNLPFEDQETCLHRYAERIGVPLRTVRRRTAVEAVYDTLLYFVARKIRLLAKTWDWCSSRTIDGGYLNVGGFEPNGVQILSFSRGIRHGALGVCPNRQADI